MNQTATSEFPPDQVALEPGQILGSYRLVRALAQGGMAQLWAAEPARNTGVVQTLAIKVIRPDIAADEKYSAMFIDEANVSMAITHPNVCRTFELNKDDGILFMCMEWIAGDSLAGLLRNGRKLAAVDLPIGCKIVAEALAGLHAAHEAKDSEGVPLGVIHRDVSPPNILLSLSGQVKVSDFGIAKARHQLHERTKTGEVKGKFGYLAPEQITGQKADRRVDVYAMGCVLYVTTVGLRPFGHGPEAMTKILKGSVKRPSEVHPDFPLDLEEIIMRAIARNPDDRFATAAEMRLALEKWIVSKKEVVTQSHIATALKERLTPEALVAIRQLKARKTGNSPIGAGQDPFQSDEPETASTRVVESVRSQHMRCLGAPPESDKTVQTAFEPAALPTATTAIDSSLAEEAQATSQPAPTRYLFAAAGLAGVAALLYSLL